MSGLKQLEEAIKNLKTVLYEKGFCEAFIKATYDTLKKEFVAFKKQLQDDILRLDVHRKKTLQSLKDFYDRLPDIKDARMAMIEFKAQNDELQDYTIELEEVFNKLVKGMEDELRIKQLIANRPKLAPPKYKWRKGHQVRKELLEK